MTTKNCGTCEFWDREKSLYRLSNGESIAKCNAPVPFWVSNQNNIDDTPYSYDGQYCQIYKERKDD